MIEFAISSAEVTVLKYFRSFISPVSILAPTLLVSGCTGSISGAPDRVFSLEEEAGVARSLASQTVYAQYFQSIDETTRRLLRRQIIFAKMYGIDVQYSEYEAKLTQEKQEEGFLSTIATLGLTSAATTVGSAEMKTLLAAAATGVTGASEAYSKDILMDRTIAILQEEMRAQRKIVRATIIDRLKLSVTDYPLELALGDVDSYYRAGTITGALIGASQQSGLALSAATTIENQVVSSQFTQTALGDRILAFSRASAVNQKAVREWLAGHGFDVPITYFAHAETYASDRQRLVDDLLTRPVAPAPLSPRVIPGPRGPSPAPRSPSGRGQRVAVPPAGSPQAAIERFSRTSEGMRKIEAWLKRQPDRATFVDLLSPDHAEDQRRIIDELHIP